MLNLCWAVPGGGAGALLEWGLGTHGFKGLSHDVTGLQVWVGLRLADWASRAPLSGLLGVTSAGRGGCLGTHGCKGLSQDKAYGLACR